MPQTEAPACNLCADPTLLSTRVIWQATSPNNVDGRLVRYCPACERDKNTYKPASNQLLVIVRGVGTNNGLIVPLLDIVGAITAENLGNYFLVLAAGVETIQRYWPNGWLLLRTRMATRPFSDYLIERFRVIGIQAGAQIYLLSHMADPVSEGNVVSVHELQPAMNPPDFEPFVDVTQTTRFTSRSVCPTCHGGAGIDLERQRCKNPLCPHPSLVS